jgi:hypothetical protein
VVHQVLERIIHPQLAAFLEERLQNSVVMGPLETLTRGAGLSVVMRSLNLYSYLRVHHPDLLHKLSSYERTLSSDQMRSFQRNLEMLFQVTGDNISAIPGLAVEGMGRMMQFRDLNATMVPSLAEACSRFTVEQEERFLGFPILSESQRLVQNRRMKMHLQSIFRVIPFALMTSPPIPCTESEKKEFQRNINHLFFEYYKPCCSLVRVAEEFCEHQITNSNISIL